MKVNRQDVSNNFDTKQKYTRTIYTCKKDDTWTTTEIPED